MYSFTRNLFIKTQSMYICMIDVTTKHIAHVLRQMIEGKTLP